MGSFVAGLVFLVAAAGAVAVEDKRRRHAAITEDCARHRPRYECTALWRAGSRDDPAIIPLPTPIPLRRRPAPRPPSA